MAEIIAASFRTEAQKLALSDKCLQSLSPRTLPVAASLSETNAEVKAGMQTQRQKQSGENMFKHGTNSIIKYWASLSPFFNASLSWVPRTVMGTLPESCLSQKYKMQGVTLAFFNESVAWVPRNRYSA